MWACDTKKIDDATRFYTKGLNSSSNDCDFGDDSDDNNSSDNNA